MTKLNTHSLQTVDGTPTAAGAVGEAIASKPCATPTAALLIVEHQQRNKRERFNNNFRPFLQHRQYLFVEP
jgi:hypothetical protein